MKDDPAFPLPQVQFKQDCGLTKREYFAAIALQGYLSKDTSPWAMETKINLAISHADALIKALKND